MVGNPDGISLLLRLSALAVVASVVASRFTPADLRAFLIGIVGVAVLEVVLGLAEIFAGKPIPWGYGKYSSGVEVKLPNPFLGDGVFRVEGSTGHPIVFGTVMVIALCLVVLTPLVRRRAWKVTLYQCIKMSRGR